MSGARRRFRAVVFDWDGTAVADRRENASALVTLAEALLRQGVWLVPVTGTNFGNLDRQFCTHVEPVLRRRLLVCTNRGSEVYGFSTEGAVLQRWLRRSTPQEERTLTQIAEAVRDAIMSRTGLAVGVVYDRLNRRKIDLIPESRWADPPKSEIGALLQAVENRLAGGGWGGGLHEAIQLTRELCARFGLPEAKVTSDVKHIEVGLTDKGDSVAWIHRNLLRRLQIASRDVLIAGDEFGPVAGFAGSDDRLRLRLGASYVVSVGKEQNGVPAGVVPLAGGPLRFRALLAEQVELRWKRLDGRGRPTAAGSSLAAAVDPAWELAERGYRPALEREVESRLALGNGLVGSRASLEQSAPGSLPRTYVAGVFGLLEGEPAIPALAAAPDWQRLQLTVDGTVAAHRHTDGGQLTRRLDLRRAVLHSEWLWHDPAGRHVSVRGSRFLSQADRHLAVQQVRIGVRTPLAMELGLHLEPSGAVPALVPDGLSGCWSTPQSVFGIAIAENATLALGSSPSRPLNVDTPQRWVAVPETPATLTRVTAFVQSEGVAGPAAVRAAALHANQALGRGYGRLLAAHERAWQQRWDACDVEITGDPDAQQALRFAAYHLNSAVNPDNPYVSIASRGLTGEAYLGHVFWDTEIFMLPFFLYTWPEAARSLLGYRYRTLPAARAKAAALGYRGALYAWESTDTGMETTPAFARGPDGQQIAILCGIKGHHISADIAYAVWQYWLATGDHRFLEREGAEILCETARFWASRAELGADGRYHIADVIGPDEYHEGVDDNAFTNGMARWNLERALEAVRLVQRRNPECWQALALRLDLDDSELSLWQEVAQRLFEGRIADGGVVEQFAGYFDREPMDLAAYAGRTVPMDVVLGHERIQRSQVIKQADVVMLQALLWDRFTEEAHRVNFRYYEPRCGHGSSLSPAIHALVAARLGDTELAGHYFREAAAIDLVDGAGVVAAGIHMATMGGLWQAAVLGFGGVSPGADAAIEVRPHLPPHWTRLSFPLRWRHRRLRLELDGMEHTLTVTLQQGRPLLVRAGRSAHRLRAGETWRCAWGDEQ